MRDTYVLMVYLHVQSSSKCYYRIDSFCVFNFMNRSKIYFRKIKISIKYILETFSVLKRKFRKAIFYQFVLISFQIQ